MSIERMSDAGRPKESPVDQERAKLVEEVFRKYHKELIRWCAYKLNGARKNRGLVSYNLTSDAEEIVAYVYQRYLKSSNPVDLTRSEREIQVFLNTALEKAIDDFIEMSNAQKRIPPTNIEYLEEIMPEDEEDLSPTLKKYFLEPGNEKEEMHIKIDQAISEIEKRNKKIAEILKQRYYEGKSISEIAKFYGDSTDNINMLRKKGEEIIKGLIEGKIKSILSIPKRG